MDRAVTATEANQRFSEILREVAAGNSVTVTSAGNLGGKDAPWKPGSPEQEQQLGKGQQLGRDTYVAPLDTRRAYYD
jgi:antitoxin (DNA-binding transcriptional repressor) of toxin-antitoxin stability system